MFFDLLQEQSEIFIRPGLIVFRLHHLHKWIEKPSVGGVWPLGGDTRVFYKNKEKQRQHLFKALLIVMGEGSPRRPRCAVCCLMERDTSGSPGL